MDGPEDQRRTAVPDLVWQDAGDRRLRCEAQLRAELREEFDRRLDEGMCRFEAA